MQNFGKGNYDALIYALSERLNKRYYQVRYYLDAFFLIIGFSLGGIVAFGTVFSMLFIGRFINFILNKFDPA